MHLIIGLTGGIGSGKTFVAKQFETLGIPIYYADIEAKNVMSKSKIIKRKLIQKFGKKTYLNNELNRPFLANLVFTNKDNLRYLESVVHPKVKQHFKRWVKKQKANYVIQENAILFENKSNKQCDFIITVSAPLEIRIKRVMARDKISKKQVLARINNQLPQEYKLENADFIIENIDKEKTIIAVNKLHRKLKHNAEIILNS